MEALKKLPIGIQDFEKLRKGDYLYVDKTDLVYQLANSGSYFFLSRPRRFGKSMLLSTLKAYFEGRKDLFEGLDLSRLETKWIQYPVLHLDLNTVKENVAGSLDDVLDAWLSKQEEIYGSRPYERTFGLRFMGIIERAYAKTNRPVVILVDEYDKPILQTIGNEPLQQQYRSTLKELYGVLKTEDKFIQFALLTGVTKFGKVSVFSDLNNLNDISMDSRYLTLCGITDTELDGALRPYVQRLAEQKNLSEQDTRAQLKSLYDGYHFRANSVGLYNPFSLLNTFDKNEFDSYWFATGTPTYLVTLLQRHHFYLENLISLEEEPAELNSIDSQTSDPIPTIYQSGYLTITGYNEEYRRYKLGFPNKEVEEGFLKFLLPYYIHKAGERNTKFFVTDFVADVRAGNVDQFLTRLASLFADTTYEIVGDMELYYQNALFLITRLMGFYVTAEYNTSDGRIDIVLKTDKYIYLIECKLDGSADEALQQIADKDYQRPFVVDGRKIVCIGLNFSSSTRGIERWVVKQ
jgi:hypothetical protein